MILLYATMSKFAASETDVRPEAVKCVLGEMKFTVRTWFGGFCGCAGRHEDRNSENVGG